MSDEEAIERAIKIIEHAVSNHRARAEVHRFPDTLCTDRGRAISQQEPRLGQRRRPASPKEIHDAWDRDFFSPPRLQVPGADCRLSGQYAQRRGHDPELGLTAHKCVRRCPIDLPQIAIT
jgi:hypothetical protein